MGRLGITAIGGVLLTLLSCASGPDEVAPLIKEDLDPEFASYKDKLADIAILPVEDATGADHGSLSPTLRRYVYQSLIAKYYTPLALEAVDRVVAGLPAEARSRPEAMLGKLQEDAALAIRVLQWDTTWFARGKVLTGVSATLIRSSDGKKIWEYEARDRYLAVPVAARGETPDVRRDAVLEVLARELTKGLPRRR
jgi:hypothetical protein